MCQLTCTLQVAEACLRFMCLLQAQPVLCPVVQIAAEDDAIASHTVVRLPVGSYRQRLNKLAQGARNALGSLPKDAKSEDQVQVSPDYTVV